MLKAIETRYKGYRFRSRLEARWACFFDACGVQWEYEKEGFELEGVGRYLPDFWVSLPKQSGKKGVWIEIKPETPTVDETRKMLRLAHADNEWLGLIVAGTPGEELIWLFDCEGNFGPDTTKGYPVWDDLLGFLYFKIDSPVSAAYRAARAARFEHGENGNVR